MFHENHRKLKSQQVERNATPTHNNITFILLQIVGKKKIIRINDFHFGNVTRAENVFVCLAENVKCGGMQITLSFSLDMNYLSMTLGLDYQWNWNCKTSREMRENVLLLILLFFWCLVFLFSSLHNVLSSIYFWVYRSFSSVGSVNYGFL